MFKKTGLCFLIISCVFIALSGCGDSKDKDKELEAAIKANKELEAELLALARKAEEEGKAKSPAVSVCDRTTAIQEIILLKVKKTDCKTVTDKDLAAIKVVMGLEASLPALKAGDFSGLTSLGALLLGFDNSVNSLSEGLFSDLTSLGMLICYGDNISFLPPNLLSGLSSLEVVNLDFRKLNKLSVDFFSGLTNLQVIVLEDNIRNYPEGLFSNLPSLKGLEIGFLLSEEKQRIQAEVGSDVKIK